MRPYLLFDHDGVLVDSERWYFAATQTALAGIGVDLDQATYLAFMAEGRPCWELARMAEVPDPDIARAREARDALYRRHLVEQPIEIEGVEEVVRDLGNQCQMGIITTSKRGDFDWIHRRRSLRSHFEFVITVEDVTAAKPAPDPYLAGLQRFGAEPGDAVAIEDSARGLRSAVAAGIDCIVIRTEFTASQDFSGAWKIVDSILELPAALGA